MSYLNRKKHAKHHFRTESESLITISKNLKFCQKDIVKTFFNVINDHLLFQGARIIKASHFMKRYHLGRKISFICVAKGYPRPNITWMKDGLELDAYAGYEHVSYK